MAKRRHSLRSQQRRASILRSSLADPGGGITTHGAAVMAEGLGGVPSACTIVGHCQTFIFELPGYYLVADSAVERGLIYSGDGFSASIVSDLPRYFQQGGTESPHYAIDCSLRDVVARVYERECNQCKHPNVPVFLVVEQREGVPATGLERECFAIDASHIEGGKKGQLALLAIKTTDGKWPDFVPDSHTVKLLLAAIKVERGITHYIMEHVNRSCFVTDDNRAVVALKPEVNVTYGGVRVDSRLDEKDLAMKVKNIGRVFERMRRDAESKPQAAELLESILLDKSDDDKYFRLWYLRLWQAFMDARKSVLNLKREPAATDIVAGEKTIEELSKYRDNIAHWWTGSVDFAYMTDIQRTMVELLRDEYGSDE